MRDNKDTTARSFGKNLIDDDSANSCLVPNKQNEISAEQWNTSSSRDSFDDVTGRCTSNTLLLGANFQWYYRKTHMAMYVLCLGVILILYILIYRSVVARGARRTRSRGKHAPEMTTCRFTLCTPQPTAESSVHCSSSVIVVEEANQPDTVVNVSHDVTNNVNNQVSVETPTLEPALTVLRKTNWLDSACAANLRIAAMLGVVTVVFVLSFLPAWLISQGFVPPLMVIFYLYFANNAANPVIYSFMNKNFRDSLHSVTCKCSAAGTKHGVRLTDGGCVKNYHRGGNTGTRNM